MADGGTAMKRETLPIRPGDDPALDAQLTRAAAYGTEFPFQLANHLPMLMVVLAGLGATRAQRDRFFFHYAGSVGLIPAPADRGRVSAATWRDHLGDRSYQGDYRGFFAGEVDRLGPDAAIATYLPALAPGVAASALHGMMRLAYARLRGDATELGIALGYWATTFLSFGSGKGAAPDTNDPADVLRRMAAEPAYTKVHSGTDLLWHWMRACARTPHFAPVIDWLRIGPDTLPRIASVSRALFATLVGTGNSGEFASLHAVTGGHWLRVLADDGVAVDVLVRRFWQTIAATFPYMRCPALPSAEQVEAWRHLPAPPWDDIKAAACNSLDEHDPSLVFSAWQEEAVYGDPLYRVIAAKRMKLIA